MNVTGLSAASAYAVTVTSKDAAGNVSAQSAALTVTTLAPPDIQAPTSPLNLASNDITSTSFSVSWTASTDNVGVVSYEVFRDGISAGTTNTTSMNITGLTSGTTYSVYVVAKDAAGNVSAQSVSMSVATTSTPISSTMKPHNIITPNGDGQNDMWMIEGMVATVKHAVKVYDSTGRVVYESNDYQNNWDGTNEGKTLITGAYYYTIMVDGKMTKGFVTILNN